MNVYVPMTEAKKVKEGLTPFKVALLEGTSTPVRRWCVEDWIPDGQVTSLYGDGGSGKSLLAMQLGTACALGSEWLGMSVAQRTVLYVSCEDDRDELQIRQTRINEAAGVTFADLDGRYFWLPRPGEESAMMTFHRNGQGKPTQFANEVLQTAKDLGVTLLIIDTAADVFGGLEIDRSQVRQFLSHLRKIAIAIDGAVVLLAHPSVAGMRDGSGYSGSTAWRGGVRSLLTFEFEKDEDGDADQRVLTRKKANYAKSGTTIGVRYEGGVFKTVTAQIPGRLLDDAEDDYRYLKALRKALDAGLAPSPSEHRNEYAPKLLRKNASKEVGDMDFKRLKAIHTRLIEAGKIAVFTPQRSNVVAPVDYDFANWRKPKS